MTSLIVCATAWTTGCASRPLRAVVDVVPSGVSYSFEVRSEDPGEAARAETALGVESPGVAEPWEWLELCGLHGHSEQGPLLGDGHGALGHADVLGVLGDSSASAQQLDPELGPVDLGYPLLVDLGAGEAPYDDGVPTIHGVEMTRGGFSDALLQASWRETITRSSMLHTTVAVSRYQDIGMLDGLSDMRFAWLVFGWKTSF